jgi:hypothetical protein
LKEDLDQLRRAAGVETGVFEEIFAVKDDPARFSREAISQLFGRFYQATEKLAEVVDGLQS